MLQSVTLTPARRTLESASTATATITLTQFKKRLCRKPSTRAHAIHEFSSPWKTPPLRITLRRRFDKLNATQNYTPTNLRSRTGGLVR